MSLPREKATDRAALPHRFEPAAARDECQVCFSIELDARHVAWERAQEQPGQDASLPRELGV